MARGNPSARIAARQGRAPARTPFACALLAATALVPAAARAGCEDDINGRLFLTQCAGDVPGYAWQEDNADYTNRTLTVSSLSGDITRAPQDTGPQYHAPALVLDNTKALARDMFLTQVRLSDATYGIDADGHAVVVAGNGIAGVDGTSSGAHGGNGTRGLDAGQSNLILGVPYVIARFPEGLEGDDLAPLAAILVSANGGPGGAGGDGYNGGIIGSASGGKGAWGRNGGDALLTMNRRVEIVVTDGIGILVETMGGDGGDGGYANAGGGGSATGGDGGRGGQGGYVTVKADADVTTKGKNAIGVVARSYGGAGGDGGDTSTGLGKGEGGAAAGSGPGRGVDVDWSGSVTTEGDGAHGIVLQSVGGFSGDGGSGGGFVGYGASSESAGDGWDVSLILRNGDISTAGDEAHGIVAQSIGGGGGLGGSGFGVVALGGTGAAGGDGRGVTVDSYGRSVTTHGDGAIGIAAASLGGGGGNADVTGGLVGIGGDGGAGGNGGTVVLRNTATILTEGEDSHGLSATSIGGGGGAAEFTAAAFSVGGQGDTGGNGRTARVANSGAITTRGDDALGVEVLSLGGGGGTGSNAYTGSVLLAVAVGGDGGAGGNGSTATYTDHDASAYTIATHGDRADAISAMSIGGGGGRGGNAQGGASGFVVGFGVTIGHTGGGGEAGHGDAATVTTGADILTTGTDSSAIQAISLGGGGGDSGSDLLVQLGGKVNIGMVFAGSAAKGGDGGAVAVEASGNLETRGTMSDAIFAQSLGGGGGVANSAHSGGVSLGHMLALNLSFGVSGGAGGDADTVTVDQSGTIATGGDRARGILAQSVGGGGGAGSTVTNLTGLSLLEASYSMGGTGGTGGAGGDVDVSAAGTIRTEGDTADAILAQSIGGGGGTGGGVISAELVSALALDIGVGGRGGAGGDGAAVAVTLAEPGAIATAGINAAGILAQSIGGGGGSGGLVLRANLTGGNFGLNLGSGEGSTGDADESTVTVAGTITTEGDGAQAIIAQSVGGGGGRLSASFEETDDLAPNILVGGMGQGDAGSVAVTLLDTATLATTGDDAIAVIAQAVGGGGGLVSAAFADESERKITSRVGGRRKGRGDGAAANVQNAGTIATAGARSAGIAAQSIGGGGGLVLLGTEFERVDLTVGGDESGGGKGGAVTIDNADGTIVTGGEAAAGIIAQSIGGSGGLTDDAMYAFVGDLDTLAIGYGVGGTEDGFRAIRHGKGGSAGRVTVNAGDITTTGTAAHGVVAQSVAGGGGIAAARDSSGALLAAMAGSIGDSGSAGTVTVNARGTVDVSGADAHGIVAQSVAGAGATGASVSINVSGTVVARGDGGRAILAQSDGGNGGATITVDVAAAGTVHAGAAAEAAIVLVDGDRNEIRNEGAIAAEEGGLAVIGRDARTRIDNYGVISGSYDLAADPGSALGSLVYNHKGGVLELGTTSDLGARGVLANEGIMTAGGLGRIATATVNASRDGGIAQDPFSTGHGTLWVDHSLGDGETTAARSDLIRTNRSVVLLNTVTPNLVGVNLAQTGDTGELAIVEYETGDSIIDLAVEDSAAVDYTLVEHVGAETTTLALAYTVDLSPWDETDTAGSAGAAAAPGAGAGAASTVTRNDEGFAAYLNRLAAARTRERAQNASGGPVSQDYAFVEELFNYVLQIGGVDALIDNYEGLTPNIYSAPLDATLMSSIDFADALLSCPDIGGNTVRTGDGETGCGWAQMGGAYLNRNQTSKTLGYEETSLRIAAGAQAEIYDGLTAGLGFSYDHATLDAERLNSGTGNRLQAGLMVEQALGAWRVGGGVTGGFGDYDIDRVVPTPGGLAVANGDTTVGFVSVNARIARAFEFGGLAVTPMLDAGLHNQWRDAFSETGAGAYGMRMESYSETFATLSPRVEVAGTFRVGAADARAYARAGVLGIFGDDRAFEAAFAGVPDGGPTLTVRDDPDTVFANLATGIEAALGARWSMRLEAKTLLGDNEQVYAGSARLNLSF